MVVIGSEQEDATPRSWFDVACALGSGAMTISLSVGVITLNKILMRPDQFPYAAPLAWMNMGFCSLFSALLLAVAPSLFPSLTDPKSKISVDKGFVLRGMLPIGIAFAANLVCANMSYRYLSIAFVQMVKRPTDLVLVYVFSLFASLERFAWWHLQVIVFTSFAMSLTISGELHFSAVGFALSMASQVFECSRIVAMGVLLSGVKLDALSCVLCLSPACFLSLGTLLGVSAALPESVAPPDLGLPPAEKLYEYAPLLLVSCCLSFALSLSGMVFIKYTSAVGYMFLGILKDMVAVSVSMFILHEGVSGIQRIAFMLQLLAILTWSTMKTAPKDVQGKGLFGGVATLISGKLGLEKSD